MAPTADFYDKLAPFYHLIFENWQSSIARQATALDSIIRSAVGPYAHSVLDVACGIGTQAIGLAARGYRVTASDISAGAVQRARLESNQRNLTIEFSVADMRAAYSHHKQTFDIVLCADNSLPHLLTDQEIKIQFHCAQAGVSFRLHLVSPKLKRDPKSPELKSSAFPLSRNDEQGTFLIFLRVLRSPWSSM